MSAVTTFYVYFSRISFVHGKNFSKRKSCLNCFQVQWNTENRMSEIGRMLKSERMLVWISDIAKKAKHLKTEQNCSDFKRQTSLDRF